MNEPSRPSSGLQRHRAETDKRQSRENAIIKAAVDLLLPPRRIYLSKDQANAARSRCEESVLDARSDVRFASEIGTAPYRSKQATVELKKLAALYQRERQAIERLPITMRSKFFPSDHNREKLVRELLALPSAPKHRLDHDKRAAVSSAAFLLNAYGYPITATRSGLWHQLSAILYADPKADLFRHMREFVHTQRKQAIDSRRQNRRRRPLRNLAKYWAREDALRKVHSGPKPVS